MFSCAHPDCNATFSGVGTFKKVWEDAKREGWRCLKVGTNWMHWCSWVHIPNDSTLKRMEDGA